MIWPFSRTSRREKSPPSRSDLFDLHCHLLYGIDDGASNPKESNAMHKGLGDLGYAGIAATPHFNHPMFPTPASAELDAQIEILNRPGDAPLPQVISGAEIMLQSDYRNGFDEGTFPRIGNTYLVEFTNRPGAVPAKFENFVFEQQVAGHYLLLAHVERQAAFLSNPQHLERLQDRGALLQLDLMSLIGRYGRAPMDFGWKLIRDGAIHVVATDLHKPKDLPGVARSLDALELFDPEAFVRLASIQPKHIFNGNPHLIE